MQTHEMKKNKQLMINTIAGLLNFIISTGISLVLTPYIINQIGADAMTFVGISTNLINMATILTTALNSLAGRFIAIKIHQNDEKGSNEYFNSVLGANIIISLLLFLPVVVMVFFLERFMEIPPELVGDTKILFAFVFGNFFVTIIGSAFSMATFAANKLYLTSLRNIEANVLRVVLYILMFRFLEPRVAYVGMITFLTSAYIFMTNIRYTKKLLPQICVKRTYFKFAYVKDIVASGVWNTITNLGQSLTNELDLLITKKYIGSHESGQLTPAKQLSTQVSEMTTVMAYIFTPQLTIYYAKNQIKELVDELKTSMKMAGLFSNVPLCFLFSFGLQFIKVWLTSSEIDPQFVYQLTILTVFGNVVGGVITPMFNLFTVTNQIKANSLVVLSMGILSTMIVFVLLATTDLGVYAVAGVSTTLGVIKNMTFVPMYAAKCLKVKRTTFYPLIFRYLLTTVVLLFADILLAQMIPVNDWMGVLISIFACGVAGIIVNVLLLLGNKERRMLWDFVMIKILRQ